MWARLLSFHYVTTCNVIVKPDRPRLGPGPVRFGPMPTTPNFPTRSGLPRRVRWSAAATATSGTTTQRSRRSTRSTPNQRKRFTRLARTARNLRLKEWGAFQLGDDDWFILGAVYNAKTVGLLQVLAVLGISDDHSLGEQATSDVVEHRSRPPRFPSRPLPTTYKVRSAIISTRTMSPSARTTPAAAGRGRWICM